MKMSNSTACPHLVALHDAYDGLVQQCAKETPGLARYIDCDANY